MRKSTDLPKPTEAELGILNVLWERGASTVRDIHEVLYRAGAALPQHVQDAELRFGQIGRASCRERVCLLV